MARFTMMVLSQDPSKINQDHLLEYLSVIPYYEPQEYEMALTASTMSFELIAPGGRESRVHAVYYDGEINPGLPGHKVHLVVVDEFNNFRMRDEFARQYGLHLEAEYLERHGHYLLQNSGYSLAGYTFDETNVDRLQYGMGTYTQTRH